tara:strand:- start:170 stop:454 length:285 start_codon:yes stop_codon:yes gene_type:complete
MRHSLLTHLREQNAITVKLCVGKDSGKRYITYTTADGYASIPVGSSDASQGCALKDLYVIMVQDRDNPTEKIAIATANATDNANVVEEMQLETA